MLQDVITSCMVREVGVELVAGHHGMPDTVSKRYALIERIAADLGRFGLDGLFYCMPFVTEQAGNGNRLVSYQRLNEQRDKLIVRVQAKGGEGVFRCWIWSDVISAPDLLKVVKGRRILPALRDQRSEESILGRFNEMEVQIDSEYLELLDRLEELDQRRAVIKRHRRSLT